MKVSTVLGALYFLILHQESLPLLFQVIDIGRFCIPSKT